MSHLSPVESAPAVDFTQFVDGPLARDALRQAITASTRGPEPQAVQALLPLARAGQSAGAVTTLAERLVQGLRAHDHGNTQANLVQGLLQEYALSSQEGVALMCLAEALLRIPDQATRDALIRDKISHGQWRDHVGHSPSVFVNAATWGLVVTGKLVATHAADRLSQALGGLIRKGGEPLIRKGVDMAMRMMGRQFVTGETIALALKHAEGPQAQGFRYSYDMLGEAAMTADDAQTYFEAYARAIAAIGAAARGDSVRERAGISIKLSALHPRYSRAQYARVMSELYPRLLQLAEQARAANIGLNIDAEEADRLELSLDLLERLCMAPSLQGFDGLGFVVQAYQKRCPAVIDWLIDLGQRSGHRLMVRLVKGAYWDSEIKRAQVEGLSDYPVYTRKAHTDAAYLACARKLLAAPEAIYPQFATHNAHTVAAIAHMADLASYTPGQYEFQCLHGMGEPLYAQIVSGEALGQPRPCRIYAPVGSHETLLAYLVRRLLENGANTSFVNRVADPDLPLAELIEDPVLSIERQGQASPLGAPHPQIPLPAALLGPQRINSRGMDLSDEATLASLQRALQAGAQTLARAPLMLATPPSSPRPWGEVLNPAVHSDRVGEVQWAQTADVSTAVADATDAATAWAQVAPAERAACLARAADAMQAHEADLMGLLMREAGKTAANAVAEIREAIDFLRDYGGQVAQHFNPDHHLPLGPVVCISPWNFPLAIFTGQIAAALAAGNPVLAKPAEQTPLVAAKAVALLHDAGVPRAALQLLHGDGHIGAALVADERVQGVVFTGSTEVAKRIQAQLAQRLGAHGQAVPLIAETGGQNAMIVDSSALTEQVIADAVASAFDSAGQRCSALRVLCVQEDVAERVITMLRGAMAELRVGDPSRLAIDVGPVIDTEAQSQIEQHIDQMRQQGHRVHQSPLSMEVACGGTFVAPTLIELPDLHLLKREVFGPVCHVLRYRRERLDELLEQIHATGYGLTLGLHTRMDETIARVRARARVGNLYVNRNQVGAVVGVQPFGGEGLSGTGPKAGGPLYLYRLLAQRPAADIERIVSPALRAELTLPGPTGEGNHYRCVPRDVVLCLGQDPADLAAQTAAVCAVGATPLWPRAAQAASATLPPERQARLRWVDDWRDPAVAFDLVLCHAEPAEFMAVQQHLAQRPGPIVLAWRGAPGERELPLERLVLERSVSINTAAAGGNASLMALG
jgi:RHH-type proline utilization regulon transcriptional repressor/proline dehydrogenase/delta 1-pyrroline-5-carboxylate dehydrogenase